MEGLTETLIRTLCDPTTYRNGEHYQQQGAVRQLIKIGATLRAGVWGEGKYHVRVSLDRVAHREFTCSCPSYRFPCKHIIAVLLQAVRKGARLETDSLDDLLDSLTPQALRTVILRALEEHPGLLSLIQRISISQKLETTTPTLPDLGHLEESLLSLIEQYHDDTERGGWEKEEEAAETFKEAFNELLEMVSQTSQVHGAYEAAHVARVMTACLIEEHDLSDLAWEMVDVLQKEWISLALDSSWTPEQRDEISQNLHGLFEPKKSKKWLPFLAQLVAQGWDYPPLKCALESADGFEEAHEDAVDWDPLASIACDKLHQQGKFAAASRLAYRAQDWATYAQDLIHLDQVDKAITFVDYISYPPNLLEVVETLQQKGHFVQAIEVARTGIKRAEGSYISAQPFFHLAQKAAEALDNQPLALEITFELLAYRPTTEDLESCKRIAGSKWEQLKDQALSIVQKHTSLSAVQILLDEGRESAALEIAKKKDFSWSLWGFQDESKLEVLNRLVPHDPTWIYELAMKQTSKIIEAKSRYPNCQPWLELAYRAAQAKKSPQVWKESLDKLMQDHWRKRNLIPILRQIVASAS